MMVYTSVPEDCLDLNKKLITQNAAFHLGFQYSPKYLFRGGLILREKLQQTTKKHTKITKHAKS